MLYENKGHALIVGYSESRYCVFIGGKLKCRKNKKHVVVAKSRVEAKYRTMALTCELIWLKHLLKELRFGKDT